MYLNFRYVFSGFQRQELAKWTHWSEEEVQAWYRNWQTEVGGSRMAIGTYLLYIPSQAQKKLLGLNIQKINHDDL